jgi:carboxymethylenebutenolidase
VTLQTAERITIDTDDGPMPAHLWLPPAGTGPALVLVQEIFGVSSYIRDRGRDLAALGYVVCAPEIYWRLPDAGMDESDPEVLGRAMSLVSRVDWPAAVRDVQATLRHLRALSEVTGGVGLIGFCFGGGLAFNVAAVDDVDVLVSYYGSALGDLTDLAGDVDARSLHHFGTADAFIPAETIERVRSAVTAHGAQFETYEGANHAFDNPSPAFHHPQASAAAWQVTVRFLNQHLPT